ncbi:MAG: UxaA family hydrolase [Pseudomonadota bacterium]
MTAFAVRLDPHDHVATALRRLAEGEVIVVSGPGDATHVRALETIPPFHKMALTALPAGTKILKYGAVIGELTRPVNAGGLVHIHNLQSLRGRSVRHTPPGEGRIP